MTKVAAGACSQGALDPADLIGIGLASARAGNDTLHFLGELKPRAAGDEPAAAYLGQRLPARHDPAVKTLSLRFDAPFTWASFSSAMELVISLRGKDKARHLDNTKNLDRAYLDEVTFKPIPDSTARKAAFDAGKLDAKAVIDHAALKAAGLARGGKDGVRLLGKGEFTAFRITVWDAGTGRLTADVEGGQFPGAGSAFDPTGSRFATTLLRELGKAGLLEAGGPCGFTKSGPGTLRVAGELRLSGFILYSAPTTISDDSSQPAENSPISSWLSLRLPP